MAPLLREIGRGEVHGDALGREAEARGVERGTHPLARFLDRLVGQADEKEVGNAGRDLHLHIDRHRLDPLKRHGRDPRDHPPCPQQP
ncbi:MAG: hypothetical protein JWQ89_2938 [Devosia sp.]|nr:hypothetical protein [Devosia sp.]